MFKGRKLRVSGPINFSNTLICLQNVCKLPRRKKKWAVIIAYLQDLKNSLQEPPVFVYFFFLGGGVAYLQWHGNKVIAAVTHHTSNLSIRLWSNKYTNNSTHNHLTPNYNYPQLNMYQQPYGRSVTEICQLNMRNKGYHIIQLGTKIVSYSGAV